MEIRSEKDWWDAVNSKWDYLLNIIGDQMDLGSPAYEVPGKCESLMTGRTILQELIFLKQTENTKIARYFNGAWGLASEKYAWSVPGWGLLCDLCSEEYVLYEHLIPESEF